MLERSGQVLMLQSLRHRNIVQFYGACVEPDCLAIVTELMNGGDLYTALRRCPNMMAWERVGKRVALHVALGLNYLHSRCVQRSCLCGCKDPLAAFICAVSMHVALLADRVFLQPRVHISSSASGAF